MVHQSLKRFFLSINISNDITKTKESSRWLVYNVINRFRCQIPKTGMVELEKGIEKEGKRNDADDSSLKNGIERKTSKVYGIQEHSSDDEDTSDSKWKLELAWLTKALEPALQLCRWALPTGNGVQEKAPPTTRSISEIIASIQKSKIGIQDWSLSDLTVGLYLIYLRQASTNPFEDINGVEISSNAIVQDLIYYTELAKGAYRDGAGGLAKNSMLRESNILKFVRSSSVLRPGYYLGVDHRKKLVIFGIRGTHTVYDLITDIVSSSHEEVTFEGYSTHFGTAEAARWFLTHEISSIKKCLEKYEGYRLRLVGHSLGGAIAALLAIMMRKKSSSELGFSPDVVSAITYATPPCVSKELAERCSDYVSTVVMQDDIIPRLSVASLTRLRNEILQTDWMTVIEKEDWKSIIDLVSNAKQVVSSVQDVARKLADYAKISNRKNSFVDPANNESTAVSGVPYPSKSPRTTDAIARKDGNVPPELFVPGTVYYLKRNRCGNGGGRGSDRNIESGEFFTLWRRHPGYHFQRIVLSSNVISDHKCDSHYYALRDVLKGLPVAHEEVFF